MTELEKQKIKEIYEELKLLYSMHKVSSQALAGFYDRDEDYGDIFSFDNIYLCRFDKLLESIKDIVKS